MEKKRQRLTAFLFLLVTAGIRILYFLYGNQTITDTYEYFKYAMVQLEEKELLLTSGLAYAYTEHLSKLLGFLGNRMEPVAVYQLLLQIVWLLVFFFGMRSLCGNKAAVASAGVLSVSFPVLKTIMQMGAENYFMLAFSLWLVALGVFYKKTRQGAFLRNTKSEMYLLLIGFFLGVFCIWNYISWLLAALTVYVLVLNRKNMEDRLWEQRQKNETPDKEKLMPVYSQSLTLFIGMFIGMYATLMKYTGLTGIPLAEQLIWWLEQFREFPGRCQDVSFELFLSVIVAVLLGIAVKYIEKYLLRRKLLREMYVEEQKLLQTEQAAPLPSAKPIEQDKPESASKKEEAAPDKETAPVQEKPEAETEQEAEKEAEPQKEAELQKEAEPQTETDQEAEAEVPEGYVRAEDGRMIKLLENPLPLPKKHVKKEMEFQLDVEDEFDHCTDADDDFDV